ncbi:tyrosine-type recombinase/integrase [Sinorhizobium medicae]|nr:tyrosine-type recombinase/integrase [Sinorhizobium medicae]
MKPAVTLQTDHLVAEIDRLTSRLPPLPAVVKYYDDFANEIRSVRDLSATDHVVIVLDGLKRPISFSEFGAAKQVMKQVFAEWLDQHDTHYVAIAFANVQSYIVRRGLLSLIELIVSQPFDARSHWNTFVLAEVKAGESYALRAILHSLCRLNIGHWAPQTTSIVRALKSPKVDKYRVVRIGDCFLPLDHQSLIVDHIDAMCAALSNDPQSIDTEALRDVCILVTSYQYAFRPGQIARIETADVRLYSTGAVHVAVTRIKQKDNRKRIRETRRIKREWGPLFNEFVKRRDAGSVMLEEGVPPRLLFGLTPSGASRVILELTAELTGEAWSPTDLRHTAAQRLADGGISHAGLSEFMGHSSDRVANVYFDASPPQAKRINDALAISPIYKNVAKIATTKTIDKEMLLGLPAEKQIGGVPHGIPIAGIGGCNLGQNLCMKNPVLACYTCSQFMPLNDPEIHQDVVESLRPVVTEFAAASRNNQQSPAYAQLKSTLDAARRVAEELKSEGEEEV